MMDYEDELVRFASWLWADLMRKSWGVAPSDGTVRRRVEYLKPMAKVHEYLAEQRELL